VDRIVVQQAQGGDREAFGVLATDISDRLFALAQRILRDSDAAGDALQSALVQIWRDLPALRDPDRFEAWSYRILVRCCHADRRRARRSITSLELLPGDAAVGDSQAAVAVRDELERAFIQLTAEQRTILVLIYYRDLSVAEVADVLGIPPGTVKSRHYHARVALRAAVDAQGRATQPEGRLA
jgi:RNA polymerase sigma factor (sigma-70 family)